MIDHRRAREAFQAHVLATVLATTDVVALSATANGYERASGSFITDGFVIGMELTPAGFSANVIDVVKSVSALSITTAATHAVQSSASGRSLTARLPQRRAFGGTLNPQAGQSSLRGEYIPATHRGIAGNPNSTLGIDTGLYVVTLVAPTDHGEELFDVTLAAVLARVTPGTRIAAGAHVLCIPWENSARRGQVLPYGTAGHSYAQVTIPWTAQSRTAVFTS